MIVEAEVVEELPSLLYRLVTANRQEILAHAAGAVPAAGGEVPGPAKNFVRLRPGDRVQVDLSPVDQTRGRIVRKI